MSEVKIFDYEPISVDTEEDLIRVNEYLGLKLSV